MYIFRNFRKQMRKQNILVRMLSGISRIHSALHFFIIELRFLLVVTKLSKRNCNTFSKGAYVFSKIQHGPGSVVGIATAYGLDSPGIESRWGRDFPHPSRPSLRPNQLPVQWAPGLSRGRGLTLTPHPLLVPRSKI
jgi:hypothetical protein